MKTKAKNLSERPKKQGVEQPKPVTPGVTKGQVRQRAYELYRDKLDRNELTLEDWVLAEKDLVQQMQTEAG